MKEILAAIDFSAVTSAVIAQARSLATAYAARLHIVHVVAPDPDFIGYEVGPQSVRDNLARRYHREHQQIQDMAEQLRAEKIDVTALLVQGSTVEKILEIGDRIDADLIVAGSHGGGALHRMLLGSVSEGLIRANRRAVLIVPSRPDGQD